MDIVFFYVSGRKEIPFPVEGEGRGDALHFGQRGERAHRLHADAIKGRRLDRVEGNRLRIIPVGELFRLGRGQKGVRVEDIDGELLRGEPVSLHIGGEGVVLRVGGGKFRFSPLPVLHFVRLRPAHKDGFADKTALRRRVDERARGDVRRDEHPVPIVFIGLYLLLVKPAERAHAARHVYGITLFAQKIFGEIPDILDSRVFGGKGAVLGQVVLYRIAARALLFGQGRFLFLLLAASAAAYCEGEDQREGADHG